MCGMDALCKNPMLPQVASRGCQLTRQSDMLGKAARRAKSPRHLHSGSRCVATFAPLLFSWFVYEMPQLQKLFLDRGGSGCG